ncbi:hypothetical protein SI65_02384 [Aspergillus cristatus]|uniref:MYND-type domain-containing protein n=1 Tax=Aspergillus cristatus TaxID=573508 RepID=A0A1E3BKQ5_ASPCR|nr:hypothetical protein SI65_02384 [Aspergillus cristatus]
MVTPTHLLTGSFFYAIGNTPAVNLTGPVPPDQDVDVLLLGCGDVRNVLFSVYMGTGKDRKIDFTCCDIQAEILARNIILYTLILDDTDDKDVERIWNIYYHVLLDDDSLGLLRKQAAKLLKVAATPDAWNNGQYGATLRFCDRYTFSQVSNLWESYALQPSHGEAFKEQQEKLQHSTKKAKDIQKDMVGDSTVLTGLRSTAPNTESALDDIIASYETFWKTGSCRPGDASTHLNPMLGTIDPRCVLHYGTDPVIGYHLSTAYVGLCENSPLKSHKAKAGQAGSGFMVAFNQFSTFAEAFRKSASCVRLRFVATDAVALCHTLQHLQTYKDSNTAGWYRTFRTWEPLVLDTADYSMNGTDTAPPLSFDVIDTSNLMDHFGCLNLLTGAGPLLKPKYTSTLSTELLVRREADFDEYKKSLLFGDIPTVALLLSLAPVELWTGTAAASGFDERMMVEMAGGSQADAPQMQSRFVLHWKSTAICNKPACPSAPESTKPPLTFKSKELASLLFQVFKAMFRDEDPTSWLSGIRDKLRKQTYGHYTRSSFVAILGLIRRWKMVDWDDFMRRLHDLIMNDLSLQAGTSYAAEMLVHLDVLGLRPMLESELPSRSGVTHPQCPLKHWTDVPSSLCVTMVIPREKLRLFKNASFKSGSPVVQMVLRAMDIRAQSFYMNIQAGFGNLKMFREKYAEDLALEIEEDERGWDGTAPMIVSAVVPSSVALQKLDLSTEVIFALNQSPHSFSAFSDRLGLDLAISQSTLASNDVYITKNRPNMSMPMAFSGIAGNPSKVDTKSSSSPSESGGNIEAWFHAQLTPDQSKLASVMAHIDILPGELQDILRSGTGVKTTQASTFEVSISFDTGEMVKKVRFPTPITMVGSKTRVARKSSYIEFIASVPAKKEICGLPDSLYSMVQEKRFLGVRTPHYVSLDQLPILDRFNPTKLSWLIPRLADMFSARERKTREVHMASNSRSGDVRVNFKDSLLSLIARTAGINGAQRQDVLALSDPQNGGVHVFIFISSLRLDISCQHVVLDAAVLPLSLDIMPHMIPLIDTLQQRGLMSINVDQDELLLWKHALPVMVERCRNWEHKPSCEYKTSGKVPASVEFGQQPLCSCGKGKFPAGYKTAFPGIWNKLSKYAARAAISPCFSVPFVERSFELKDLDKIQEWQNAGAVDGVAQKVEALKLKKGACFRCDKRKDSLLRCGGCKVAEYCSKECQKEDWKNGKHKVLCPLLGKK